MKVSSEELFSIIIPSFVEVSFLWIHQDICALVFVVQEMSNKEIEMTYKLKVLQQELEQEEASHKATRALLADKSKIKVTIEGAKSESMKGMSSASRGVSYHVFLLLSVYPSLSWENDNMHSESDMNYHHKPSISNTCIQIY